MCPVTTHEATHFSQTDRVGLEISVPTSFFGMRLIPPIQGFGRDSLKKVKEEGVLQGLPNQAERLPNFWGDALDELPLLL